MKNLLKITALFFALIQVASAATTPPPGSPPPPPSAPSYFNSDLYRVNKQILDSSGQVGGTARYRIHVEALGDIDQIRVLETLPAGLSFVDAQPAPNESSANARLWIINNMTRGASRDFDVTVTVNEGGWFITNTKVSVVPIVALPIFAGQAKLELTKTGPTTAELGDDISFNLTVRNVGTAAATNIVVTDTLPAGLYGPDRSSNVVTSKIDVLPAGESRTFNIPVKAAVKGDWDNRANAYSTHMLQANASAHISIIESKLTITKIGAEEAYVFGGASYTITVRNDGENYLRDVRLVDEVPAGIQFENASDGGVYRDGRINWVLGDMAPGATIVRSVNVIGQRTQTVMSTATASCDSGKRVSATTKTLWEGAPGVLTEIVDDVDPVRVGQRVTYSVKITNQSPMRELRSEAVIDISPNIKIVDVKGVKAEVIGNRILIRDITLKPRGTTSFKIVCEAQAPGLGGARLEFGAGFLPRPAVKEETTSVY